MSLRFEKISLFDRGILYKLLTDAYSFDNRWEKYCGQDWKEFDDFFFDNLDIADRYGFITVLDNEPIGHISWDPRKMPKYVEIGHNCIISRHKRKGYGKRQLQEAVSRIRQYEGLKKIIVGTNSNLIAPYNYESVGFKLKQRRENQSTADFSGDYLYYEIIL
ncbi:GNAT family N-acetyltransferase [Murimonas intestini]|uniref:GNAT family N-acetyltransferase n=1 Tax=Murimonas intestini TaxID=1337051 RepID=UPI00214CC27D|nr:GNAT family N-acetyltransferase [Murimonas intestini]MCR1868697.1 GNAT family N-acetyltransferase [Murimonas intestini]